VSESLLRRIGTLIVVLGGIGGYVFAATRSLDLLDKFNFREDVQKVIAILYIVILSALIVALLIRQYIVAGRKEKFANITPMMHSVVRECKDLYSYLTNYALVDEFPTRSEAENILKESQYRLRHVCDGLARVFAMLTSTHCRVAIKVITRAADGELHILTLARDEASHQQHAQLDKKRFEHKVDPLSENSQFMRLADDDDPTYVFFSNNLAKERNFRCTSVSAYRLHSERTRPWYERIKSDPWLLPYRSTITVAVRNSDEALAPGEPSVVGFLAVDSESRRVFNARWDPHLCSLVADALFHPINFLLAIMPDDQSDDQPEPAPSPPVQGTSGSPSSF